MRFLLTFTSHQDSIGSKTLFLHDNVRLHPRRSVILIRHIALEDQTFYPDGDGINNNQCWQKNQPFILKLIWNSPHTKDGEISRCERENEPTDCA